MSEFFTNFAYFNKRRKNEGFNVISEFATFNTIMGILLSLFEYSGVPEQSHYEYIDFFGNIDGLYCMTRIKDELYILPCTRAGEPDLNGLSNEVIVRGLNGEAFNRVEGVDCVVGYNTKDRRPNWDVEYYLNLLTNIDTSFLLNTVYSRNKPLPLATDSKVANKINKAVEDLSNGKLNTILLDDNIGKFIQEVVEGKEPVGKLDLTNPDLMKYLPELNKTYDDVMSRFLCKYGIATNYAGKMAQMSVEELSGYDIYAKQMPIRMLNARKEFCERCNDLFDINMSVDFSESFKHLKEDIEKESADEAFADEQESVEEESAEEEGAVDES